MRAKWQADDPDAFAAQEERRSSRDGAKRGGVVACGVVAGRGASYLDRVPQAMDTLVYRVPLQFEEFIMTLLYRVDGGLLAQRARRPRCLR